MDENTNLSGLDPASAKEYVLQHIISLKSLQRSRAQVREELKLWSDRVELAAQKGREDLKGLALLRCQEISAKDEALATEERQLRMDIDMKQQLEGIRRQPVQTVDADLLLAQLEQVVGESRLTEGRFQDVAADQALEELKQRLESEKDS
jgi:hypothetical protein